MIDVEALDVDMVFGVLHEADGHLGHHLGGSSPKSEATHAGNQSQTKERKGLVYVWIPWDAVAGIMGLVGDLLLEHHIVDYAVVSDFFPTQNHSEALGEPEVKD